MRGLTSPYFHLEDRTLISNGPQRATLVNITGRGLPEKFKSSPRLEIKVTLLTPFFPHLPPKSMSSYSSGPILLYSIISHPSLHSLHHSLIRFCFVLFFWFFFKYQLDMSTNLLTSLCAFSSLHIILYTIVRICKFQI